MKRLLLVLAVAAVAVPVASAGGFATVGLSSLPTNTPAGGIWSVDLTVLQHGRTPLEGITPVLTIANGDGETREFAGVATGKPGVYRVDVVFPASGTWTYAVWDGFSQSHTYKPVEIRTPAGGSFPMLPVAVIALVLLLAAALVLFLRRSRSAPHPAGTTA
ncbi:MAG TPA: hypothetical protein VM184_12175 [Gaiellaceae bacterium]|nr:hypothetical protein [Gaiellaceae bacterium]